jgi:hypothetical protein
MQFRTTVKIESLKQKIGHNDSILSLGSCFADNIASRLAAAKFQITASPSGVLFNPESIASAIERYSRAAAPTAEELREGDEGWYSFDFHSSLSHSEREVALAQMQQAVEQGAEALAKAKVVIVTFGTAWVYRFKENGRVVANCHKQHQSLFSREMLSIEEIVERYAPLMEGVLAGKKVIMTVSPIRHLSDGLEANSLSKAILRVAIDKLAERYDNVHYFPSFELLNDDLRDYRFYADDMTHPSAVAVDYIWERFEDYAFSAATTDIIKRLRKIADAVAHRPLNADTEAHRNFCLKMIGEIAAMECVTSGIDFSEEKRHFKQFL